MGRHSHDVPCTWWLSWVAVYRKVLVGTGWAISVLVAQTSVETTPVGVLFLALCRQLSVRRSVLVVHYF